MSLTDNVTDFSTNNNSSDDDGSGVSGIFRMSLADNRVSPMRYPTSPYPRLFSPVDNIEMDGENIDILDTTFEANATDGDDIRDETMMFSDPAPEPLLPDVITLDSDGEADPLPHIVDVGEREPLVMNTDDLFADVGASTNENTAEEQSSAAESNRYAEEADDECENGDESSSESSGSDDMDVKKRSGKLAVRLLREDRAKKDECAKPEEHIVGRFSLRKRSVVPQISNPAPPAKKPRQSKRQKTLSVEECMSWMERYSCRIICHDALVDQDIAMKKPSFDSMDIISKQNLKMELHPTMAEELSPDSPVWNSVHHDKFGVSVVSDDDEEGEIIIGDISESECDKTVTVEDNKTVAELTVDNEQTVMEIDLVNEEEHVGSNVSEDEKSGSGATEDGQTSSSAVGKKSKRSTKSKEGANLINRVFSIEPMPITQKQSEEKKLRTRTVRISD